MINVRFLIDHHIDPTVADGLSARGHNVTTAWAEDLEEAADRTILAHAQNQKRVVITNDDDFLSLVKKESIEHAGIIFITEQQMAVGDLIRSIVDVASEWKGRTRNRVAFV